ncbi:peptidase S10 serine carboxypeptidase [Novosphingobium nitrogenifigens DSM 19370]|uniref:Peptidase S10 serine carboxypeptidase n=1 Tax=Novosphingobium nitrogenifigens DSM 19370 TaxID=983920 RepID=F1Z4D9_9SPHN|nr:peptidase S10 [Novosphingobium nitrogenifigens]EGD60549.1 peptidase S10 serine carboxypeptidase [Novosphingobium nitrogenifigens DSM 19370]
MTLRLLPLALAGTALVLAPVAPALAADKTESSKPEDKSASGPDAIFKPQQVASSGSVTVKGQTIAYDTVAGTLVVHPAGWDDTAWRVKTKPKDDDKALPGAEASMFYVAYFKKGAPSASRPITFLFNGGPGSSSVWLHMGAFGPRRIVTSNDSHTPAAPYDLINNGSSLLDVSDLVFVDAPGTGFSRVAGKDKEKAFFGMDADADAFAGFIRAFLTRHGRWNSPKYLFGESYGTPRAAMLANKLTTDHMVDLNGVILLSQILNFDLSVDTATLNPGTDEPYIVALPTYAATAWYHNRLPGTRPAALEPFLKEVEAFATGDYAAALQQGSQLDPAKKRAIAERMATYIGLPADYILKSNLRVEGGQFTQQLQVGSELTTGRLDSRFSGPAIDVLNKEADYDPQAAAIGSAYVSAFNAYARDTLHYGQDEAYKPIIDVFRDWSFEHRQPGMPFPIRGAANVMPDLAIAMKYNPDLKVLVTGGYFDLATPYFEGWYEMHHLPIPDSLQANISYRYFASGHMVYANEESLKKLHDTVADFITATDNLKK